jgi:2-polyprenyl-6-methoxyphenol hydroxylase-like FAD-dependent oxidoreductase
MEVRILIAGGGVAGPALALFLDKAGIAATVFEASPEREDIGGALQIAPNGMWVLKELGLAEEIAGEGVASEEFALENQQGDRLGRVTNGPASKYGIPAVQIARAVLNRALVEEMGRRKIPIVFGKRLEHLVCHDSRVEAGFADGSGAEGTLLIGADGVHSRTRELVFPGGPRPHYTGLFTVGGFARHPRLAPSAPSELSTMHMIFGREGFFGYGYFDPRRPDTVMWWSHLARDPEPAREEYRSWSSEEIRRELLERHRGWHEPVRTILENAPEMLRGPVFDMPSLPAWSRERVLLIGDAAHAVSPHAGQGASLALEDAMLLGKLLHDGGAGHEELFLRFSAARRRRVERVIAEAGRRGDGKRRLSPQGAWIRDRFLSLFARLWGSRMNEWMYSYRIAWEG